MKKVFKFGCLGIIILIVLVVVIAVFTGSGDDSSTDKSDSLSKETIEGVVTKEKFEQIKDGMTYEEVVAIIGSEGTVLSETGEKGTEYYTVMYEFATDSNLSNVNMTFQNNKMIAKAQSGLEGFPKIEITLDQFNQVENGMTMDEVFEILGGKGELLSEGGATDTDAHTAIYLFYGKNSPLANANFTFQGGKLINKAQLGLE